ncbi:TPR-like protein [Laetiporus sulphureus 93-53]|uniref:TPR-like protein n=1 Tax=Laetiporus sulphureus 93-53 TaxID=1314785 RepID=A0A165F4E4_9APHY|nr:TPR-like protein [Laetiporus sulphureus 93-53]KZT08362.1 TPR-like protein [Laetiporus sulphureus 93-53]
MSLPLLVSGADCGPSNPLQGLSKRFDQDRGIQQDHFGAGRAGSSKETFRSQYSAAAGSSQDAAQFFSSSQTSPSLLAGPSAFDFSALHASLPPPHLQSPVPSPQTHTPLSPAAWATDFLQQPAKQSSASQLSLGALAQRSSVDLAQESVTHVQPQQFTPGGFSQSFRPWNSMSMGYNVGTLSPTSMMPLGMTTQVQAAGHKADAIQWEQVFESHEAALNASETVVQEAPATEQANNTSPQNVGDDELARTAGRLMETVRSEQNPKFKNSQFMGLMRQLRDGEVVVEGDKMVPKDPTSSTGASASNWANEFKGASDAKGKGREMPLSAAVSEAMIPQAVGTAYRSTPQTGIVAEHAPADLASQYEENPIDAYLREENERYIEAQKQAQPPTTVPRRDSWMDMYGSQDADWGRLQRDWDAFEATATGIRPLAHYQFQAHNPYVLGEASRTRTHQLHADARNSLFDSVLEMEAAVQREPLDALKWFELGVKQQENEREHKAVQALRRALELDPEHLPSWLALAVSHTNEGNRQGTYYAISEWVERNERYRAAVEQFRQANPESEETLQSERFANLIQCLIYMAREDAGREINADIQIALAVLLNTNEEYAMAQDCFNTALAVRPDDWLLYNRVGATLANSGRPEEALQYYYRAIELNPAYIRARFNLGISCINLRRYGEAAQHILDALLLQDGDSVYEPSGDKRGVTTHALWESLKTCCMHMQRIDLATLCDREDLEAFRLNFQMV